jgi:IS4 transposase
VIRYQLDGCKERIIATSLPKSQYKAEDIVELYHQRWEIELGYREIKSSQLRKSITLRSKTVKLVYQEVYGALLAYNLIRYETALAAEEAKVSAPRSE